MKTQLFNEFDSIALTEHRRRSELSSASLLRFDRECQREHESYLFIIEKVYSTKQNCRDPLRNLLLNWKMIHSRSFEDRCARLTNFGKVDVCENLVCSLSWFVDDEIKPEIFVKGFCMNCLRNDAIFERKERGC